MATKSCKEVKFNYMLKNQKQANMQVLVAVAMGIITLAIIVGIGLTVLARLGATQAVCAADKTYVLATDLCTNATGTAAATGNSYTSITYGMTQLGSAGLLSWLPAIIALIVGVFFLTYFMGGRKKY